MKKVTFFLFTAKILHMIHLWQGLQEPDFGVYVKKIFSVVCRGS
uniref:Uncharacterized protein n=1 Tax=Klebsiella pneumoniae TaxID=573 RepID=A0A8E6P0C9_KLEPN|nr:hypothetical protein [Klebsiella pneumoniae]URH11003.1 hypothetical protein [Klebsiella pneumoniae]UVD62431.1 hypothetical protein [Klebsiella pneumoniae]